MSTKAKRHPHKYRKATTGFGTVWACALPDCNHYMPQHMTELLPGKRSVCWGCDDIFILTPQNMRDEFPKCDNCSGGAKISEATSELERRFIEGVK